jgi:beta-phosphoglucomutase-like phosphatase (HAD superfamily)
MRLLRYVRLIPPLLRLLAQLGWLALGMAVAKRGARHAYKKALERAGLPEPFIAELVTDYNLSFRGLLRSRCSRSGRRSTGDRS